jgi:hypothetical protein
MLAAKAFLPCLQGAWGVFCSCRCIGRVVDLQPLPGTFLFLLRISMLL